MAIQPCVSVEELWINGGKFRSDRPIYVVLDSGTTVRLYRLNQVDP